MAVKMRLCWVVNQSFYIYVCAYVCMCVCESRAHFWQGEPHLENMVKLVWEGYNELACLRGCAASLFAKLRSMGRQTQSWSQRLLKGTTSCQKSLAPVLLSLPPFLSRSLLLLPVFPSLSTLYPFILSPQCETFSSLKIGSSYTTAPPLFWPVPGVKAPGIISVSPVQ